MLEHASYSGTYEATAGRLCLDFANTLSNRIGDDPHEWLASYADLTEWGQLTGILSDEAADDLRREAAGRPEQASKVLGEAIVLREAIYRIFHAVAAGTTADSSDVEHLNTALSEAMPHLRVANEAGSFDWEWTATDKALDQVIWPVTRSAAELLTSKELGRVGECKGDDCGWLFMDMSRNHSRRWCDMGDCGNRAKARRFYRRQQRSVAGEEA